MKLTKNKNKKQKTKQKTKQNKNFYIATITVPEVWGDELSEDDIQVELGRLLQTATEIVFGRILFMFKFFVDFTNCKFVNLPNNLN